jgi:hypothetical protein
MVATPSKKKDVQSAKKRVVFNSGAHILRIGTERARNLSEMLEAVRVVPDSSIFQHMFQTLADHHYIREGFSNDFAHWAFFSCNETGLAERLAGIDVREYTSIADMRQRIVQVIEEYLKRNSASAQRQSLETFYFCSSDTVVIPTSLSATSLSDFIEGLRKVSLHSIHYHFINARLRIKLNSNDFSVWLEEELGLKRLANRFEAIDIYTSTLEGVRQQMVKLAESELSQIAA